MKEYKYILPSESATYKDLTVGELIELLSTIPKELIVTYDSGCGNIWGHEIHYDDEKVILND